MPKPNYAALLAQIAQETDPTIKQQLIDACYKFGPVDGLAEGETAADYVLTESEKELFDYCAKDYIENNPGVADSTFSSYIGVYYDDEGNTT